jgi:hypothetical protein
MSAADSRSESFRTPGQPQGRIRGKLSGILTENKQICQIISEDLFFAGSLKPLIVQTFFPIISVCPRRKYHQIRQNLPLTKEKISSFLYRILTCCGEIRTNNPVNLL